MKAQHRMLKDKIEVPALTATATLLSALASAPKKNHQPKLTIAAVVLAHLALIAVAITHTTQYRPLDIINPAEQTSVEVTMVEAPQPEAPPVPQVTETPPVLTADNGERDVAQTEAAPVVAAPEIKPETPPPPKPQLKPKPKIIVKPKPEPVISRSQAQAKPSPLQNAKVADQAALPATSQGEMLKSVPNAVPKTVSTVGCQVPAPDYPRKAKRLQEEGEVLIRLVINANGTLGRSDVARSSGYDDLDQAAMAAVSRIRCNPYVENGQAIAVMTVQPITFKLTR
ncbi:TonB family protein [Sodalis sp. RH24]|uniref:energy transducer TonB n=2 Tax=unclassified Sodalis (in: enterobacteria) TaxID=2636512 RepID=UPI0039B51ADC